MDKLPYLQKSPKSIEDWFGALCALARYLRSEEGCPWDRRQTARNFAEFAQGEMDELLAAFDEGDDAHVAEEVGDCLFTLLASTVAAEAEGRFTVEDVLERCHTKIVRRHGHVFGEQRAQTSQEAVDAWHRVKEEEQRERAQREDRG